VAAVLGDGKQVVSWIHIDDLCRMYIAGIENESMQGAYNAVAPNPVTNKTLTLALAKQMHGNTFITLHVPSFVLKIVLGEMSIEVLKSATVSSEKMKAAGFEFKFPSIEKALIDLI
jgi:NAD dependent epimerase/dehydratase family enzyme